MPALSSLIAWCKHERESLTGQLEAFESGRMRIGERDRNGKFIDQTQSTIADINRKISELDALIARHPEVE